MIRSTKNIENVSGDGRISNDDEEWYSAGIQEWRTFQCGSIGRGLQTAFHSYLFLQRREEYTEVLTWNLNSPIHRYTILSALSMSREFMGKLYICLREPTGEFGPRIRGTMRVPADIVIFVARWSRKVDKKKMWEFVEKMMFDGTGPKACLIIMEQAKRPEHYCLCSRKTTTRSDITSRIHYQHH